VRPQLPVGDRLASRGKPLQQVGPLHPVLDPIGAMLLLVRPQLPAEHLADHRLRERVAELDQLRYVVAGQPLA
jgi:hypothetical protein